jgi:hypothetical protein
VIGWLRTWFVEVHSARGAPLGSNRRLTETGTQSKLEAKYVGASRAPESCHTKNPRRGDDHRQQAPNRQNQRVTGWQGDPALQPRVIATHQAPTIATSP